MEGETDCEISTPQMSSASPAITTSAESEELTKTSPSSSAITATTPTMSSTRDDAVCRDFLRNVCSRGSRCKFSHKMENGDSDKEEKIAFCHDFQNGRCGRRLSCKFIHCRREEEDQYKSSGYLPPHLRDQAVVKGVGPGGRPVCKDYLKGDCRRRGGCRFRHLSRYQYDMELLGAASTDGYGDEYDGYSRGRKRSKWSDENYDDYEEYPGGFGNGFGNGNGANKDELYYMRHENTLLKKRVEELRKQVSDLTATNEFLLEQNAQLRLGCSKQPAPPGIGPAPGPQIGPAAQPTPVSLDQPTITMAVATPLVMPASSMPSSIAHMEAPPPAVSMPVHALAPPASGPPESQLVPFTLPSARPM